MHHPFLLSLQADFLSECKAVLHISSFYLLSSLWVFVIFILFPQGDEVVLQSTFTSHNEHLKLCLAAEGFGSRLCRLEPTSNCKVYKPPPLWFHCYSWLPVCCLCHLFWPQRLQWLKECKITLKCWIILYDNDKQLRINL